MTNQVHVHVHLLGKLTITQSGTRIILPKSDKACALLAYLLLYNEKPQSRARLVGTFWPDKSESKGRQALSQTLWQLRQTIPSGLLKADRYQIQCHPHVKVWVDVLEFRQIVDYQQKRVTTQRQALYQAVDLYRGPLLEAFYDDWIIDAREHLQTLYEWVLSQLVRQEKQHQQLHKALDYAFTLTTLNPLEEAYHREIMQLYAALNRPQTALEYFAMYKQKLHDKYGLQPENETISLSRTIQQQTAVQPTTIRQAPAFLLETQQTLPMVGRQAERIQILQAITHALHNKTDTTLILLGGEAGVGKTKLIQEIVKDARWRHIQVLQNRTHATHTMPYATIHTLIAKYLTDLRRQQLRELIDEETWAFIADFVLMSEEAQSLLDSDKQQQFWEALAISLKAWSQITPFVIILEDWQDVDAQTAVLWPWLIDQLSSHPICFIVTYQPRQHLSTVHWQTIEELSQRIPHVHLQLNPLTTQETSLFIQYCLNQQEPPSHLQKRIYENTEGNPLLILHLLQMLYQEERLTQDELGHWLFNEDVADISNRLLLEIEEAIYKQLAQLSDEQELVLQVSAVIGDHIPYEWLAGVTQYKPETLLPVLWQLVRDGLLQEVAVAYTFPHRNTKQVIYNSISPEKQRDLHYKIAVYLESADKGDATQRFYHSEKSELWQQAVQYAVQSARLATNNLDYAQALAYYQKALHILEIQRPFSQEEIDVQQFTILDARQRLLWDSNNLTQPLSDLQEMLALARKMNDPEKEAKALNRQAEFYRATYIDYEHSRIVAHQALQLASQHHLSEYVCYASFILGDSYMWDGSGHFKSAAEAYQRAVNEWLKYDAFKKDIKLVWCCYDLAIIYWYLGAKEQVEYWLKRLRECAFEDMRCDQLIEEVEARLARMNGRLDQALQHAHRSQKHAQTLSLIKVEAQIDMFYGLCLWENRHYSDSFFYWESAYENWRTVNFIMQATEAACMISRYYCELGQYTQAQIRLDEMLDLIDIEKQPYLHVLLWCERANLALCRGQHQLAWQLWQEIRSHEVNLARVQLRVYEIGGVIALQREMYDLALEQFKLANRVAGSLGELQTAVLFLSYQAISYQHLGQSQKAKTYSERAMRQLNPEQNTQIPTIVYWHQWQLLHQTKSHTQALQILYQAYYTLHAQANQLPEEWQSAFWQQVTLHSQIYGLYHQQQLLSPPTTCQVKLPSLNAPKRGKLAKRNFVTVTWVLDNPLDNVAKTKAGRRRLKLRRLVKESIEQSAIPTIEDLAQILQVSARTVQRDINQLTEEGIEIRTRGQ